jgi:Zn-dependent protease
MLNEPASKDGQQSPVVIPPEGDPGDNEQLRREQRLTALQELVADVMQIETRELPGKPDAIARGSALLNPEQHYVVAFKGRLNIHSEMAYDLLDAALEPDDLLPIFRDSDGKHMIYIIEGRVQVSKPRSWIPNLLLFLVTLASVLLVGTEMALNELAVANFGEAMRLSQNLLAELWRGLPYALAVMLILGAHELGHYFAARRHHLAVTLPYFIPFPVGLFGTLGAFIQLREPLKNRKMLLDVGAAGPLMGLVFAIPILFIGLSTSTTGPINPGGLVEGNSLFYALAKSLVFGEFLPNGQIDVYVNQLAWAGWTGLFITGLNLIPLGQLDGGHVIYALLGRISRRLFYPTIVVLALLTFISNGALLLLLVLLVILGRVFAVPLDDITPLDSRRRWIAVLTLVIFLAVYVPIPLTQTEALPPLIPDRFGASLPLAYAAGALLVVIQRISTRWR